MITIFLTRNDIVVAGRPCRYAEAFTRYQRFHDYEALRDSMSQADIRNKIARDFPHVERAA